MTSEKMAEVCDRLCRQLESVLRDAVPNGSHVEAGWSIDAGGRRKYTAFIIWPGCPNASYASSTMLAWLRKIYPRIAQIDLTIQVSG